MPNKKTDNENQPKKPKIKFGKLRAVLADKLLNANPIFKSWWWKRATFKMYITLDIHLAW